MILPPVEDRPCFFWPLLVVGTMVTTMLPIGIHTVMLDDMGVLYPEALPRSGWVVVPYKALVVVGIIDMVERLSSGAA